MNSYEISSDSLCISYQNWSTDKKSDPHDHYFEGVCLRTSIDERINQLNELYLFECTGLGGAEVVSFKERQIIDQLDGMRELRNQLESDLVPTLGILAAFDISCVDYNDAIRSDIIGALEQDEVVISTKSLLTGAGSRKGEDVQKVHHQLKEKSEDYHYWIDDESQYVLMIPKKHGQEQERSKILEMLDFVPTAWIPIDATSLIESSFAKPKIDRFISLFSDHPKAHKRWIASGHGGGSSLCGMDFEDYEKFFDFLNKQETDFLYVSSCSSGGRKEWHQQKSSFPVVLGTYTGESQYSSILVKNFFKKLNFILPGGSIRSVRPFEILFSKCLKSARNNPIIHLPNSDFPFQLLHKGGKAKDLYQLDIVRAKVEKTGIDLTEKEKVCIHPSHLDVEVIVGEKTALFPYDSTTLVEIDHLRVEGNKVDAYFSFLKSFYKDVSHQKVCFFIHDLDGEQNILWVLGHHEARQWKLQSLNFKEVIAVRQLVDEAQFQEWVIPFISGECRKTLTHFNSILEKGGIDLTPDENAVFKKHCSIIVECLIKSGQLNPRLKERLFKNPKVKSHFFMCCLKYNKMDEISDLNLFGEVVSQSHCLQAIRSGNVSLLRRLVELDPKAMPDKIEDCLIQVLDGGEEMMIEMYHQLGLSSDTQCYEGLSLFKLALDLDWVYLGEMMINTVKPRGKSAHVEDDPFNLLIDACHQNGQWKPLVIKAIRKGWNPTDTEIFGHRNLPINRLIRLGMFDVFLNLLESYIPDQLSKFCYYLPLSEAINQADSRYLEIMLSMKVFSVNAEVSPGVSLLCKAVKKENYKAVELLISHGAKIHLTDPYLDQPLSLAIKLRDLKMIRLLIEHGASELSKNDYPKLIELIKHSKNDEEMLWQLMFLAYRKPSLYEPNLSKELVRFFYKNGLRAQVQWIIGRKDRHQQYLAGIYLEIFVKAADLQMVRDFLSVQIPIENKASIARLLKKAPQNTFEELSVIELLEIELHRF